MTQELYIMGAFLLGALVLYVGVRLGASIRK